MHSEVRRVQTLSNGTLTVLPSLLLETLSLSELLALGVQILCLAITEHSLLAQRCTTDMCLIVLVMLLLRGAM